MVEIRFSAPAVSVSMPLALWRRVCGELNGADPVRLGTCRDGLLVWRATADLYDALQRLLAQPSPLGLPDQESALLCRVLLVFAKGDVQVTRVAVERPQGGRHADG